MKTILFAGLISFYSLAAEGQKVGIGTNTPSEKLDVNGNLNVAGQLKFAGDSGQANQVLMKNDQNNPVWLDMREFKYLATFDCVPVATSAGSNNCSYNWTVPANTRTISVEVWGGGGGGGSFTSGAGGGYICARFSVTPGATVSIVVGAPGLYSSGTTNGIVGGTSTCTINSVPVIAFGGGGGDYRDVFASSSLSGSPPRGGDFGSLPLQYNPIGYWGSDGSVARISFMEVAPGEFAKVVHYGSGGGSAFHRNEGGGGGYRIASPGFTQAGFAQVKAAGPGCGGGADVTGGFGGRGGRVIIHY